MIDVPPLDSQPAVPKKVLLLEDDRHFGEFLRKFLSMRSYNVTLVPGGAEGMGEVLQSDFDAIICDFMMPKASGDLFYRAVQEYKPRLCSRFIFMTGNARDPKVLQFIKDCRRPLLEKPFHVNDLFRALNQMKA